MKITLTLRKVVTTVMLPVLAAAIIVAAFSAFTPAPAQAYNPPGRGYPGQMYMWVTPLYFGHQYGRFGPLGEYVIVNGAGFGQGIATLSAIAYVNGRPVQLNIQPNRVALHQWGIFPGGSFSARVFIPVTPNMLPTRFNRNPYGFGQGPVIPVVVHATSWYGFHQASAQVNIHVPRGIYGIR